MNLRFESRIATVLLALGTTQCASSTPPDFGQAAGAAGGSGLASGNGGSSGSAGASGGNGGNGGNGAGNAGGGSDSPNTAPGFTNLAPPMAEPLSPDGGTTLSPPAPNGWIWYPIDGAICRDGSPAGLFAHFTTSDKLYIYLEGGGACTSFGFCNYNPPSVNHAIAGAGETVLGSALGVVAARQQPGVFDGGVMRGIFDTANADNPLKDWNGIYVPYCTGDVHFGTRKNSMVPGVAAPQQFVGYLNMQKFIGRIVPTFKDKVNQVALIGVSAGSFAAALNFSMVQDAFGSVRVLPVTDSGPPFADEFMPVCMQKRWREVWGLNDSLPPDCDECRQADGGGLVRLAEFLLKKHPNARIAIVSSMQDEVIRLFFSSGVKDCAGYDTADPVGITVGQVLDPTVFFSAAQYTAGLNDLRARYASTGKLATYFIGGPNITFHQHLWRARFTDPAVGTETLARFITDFMSGKNAAIGP